MSKEDLNMIGILLLLIAVSFLIIALLWSTGATLTYILTVPIPIGVSSIIHNILIGIFFWFMLFLVGVLAIISD